MKTFITLLSLLVLSCSLDAQDKYSEAMKAAIGKVNSSEANGNLQQAANMFERISVMEKGKWLPKYYAAYAYIIISINEPDLLKKDSYLDKAQQFIDKAMELAPNESELYALQAFLYPPRMTVDPMARGMEYLGKFNAAINKAISLDPGNPRSYYLKAVVALNMPEAFGGGAEIAKPIFETAKDKFEKFNPGSTIHPDWGKEINQIELDKL